MCERALQYRSQSSATIGCKFPSRNSSNQVKFKCIGKYILGFAKNLKTPFMNAPHHSQRQPAKIGHKSWMFIDGVQTDCCGAFIYT